MSLKKLGNDLKSARERRLLSHNEIYQKTRINISYMENMEAGKFDFLHAPYVIAFLRTYAKYLNLNEEESANQLKEYHPYFQRKKSEVHDEPDSENRAEKNAPEEIKYESERLQEPKAVSNQDSANKKIVVSVVIVIFLVALYFAKYFLETQNPAESENLIQQQTISSPPATIDTTQASPIETESVTSEQLELRLVAIDSIWIQLSIDGSNPNEYIISDGTSRIWVAEDSFVVRTGRSTGLELYLNDEQLTNLGTENTLIWHMVLTHEGVIAKRTRLR